MFKHFALHNGKSIKVAKVMLTLFGDVNTSGSVQKAHIRQTRVSQSKTLTALDGSDHTCIR